MAEPDLIACWAASRTITSSAASLESPAWSIVSVSAVLVNFVTPEIAAMAEP
jgi:hypothetical protein